MPNRKDLPLTADLAPLPGALPLFLRIADRPLRYRWWTRICDRWAGRRDRTPVTETYEPGKTASSAWLQQLIAECDTAIAQERSRTEAMVAVLDNKQASLDTTARAAAQYIEEMRQKMEAVHSQPARAPGAGEKYSREEERQARLALERGAALARLTTAKTQAEERRRAALHEVDVLTSDRRSHGTVLRGRIRLIVEHYQRRASNYVRGMSRPRKGITYTAPLIPIPDWASAELSRVK